MKLQHLTLLSFILTALSFSCVKNTIQPPSDANDNYEKTFGGIEEDYANDIVEINNQLYIFGTSKSYGDIDGDHYLLKIDLNGNMIYQKTFGGNNIEEGDAFIKTNDGNLLLVGTTESSGAGLKDIHVLKVDTNGNIIWQNTYGGALNDIARDVIEMSNSEFCIVGNTESFGNGAKDIYMVWLDQNGSFLRQAVHGQIDIDGATEIVEIPNQELMIYGFTRNYGATSRDLYLIRTNAVGDSLWSKRYGGNDYEESQAFAKTNDDGYVLCGHSASIDPDHNIIAIRLDNNGNEIWSKNFGGTQHDGGEALLIDQSNRYVFIGRTMSFGQGKRDTYMVITNSDGVIQTTTSFGGPELDKINEVIEVGNFYYLTGSTNSYGSGKNDVYLIKHHR